VEIPFKPARVIL
jgi:aconitate hydratase